jgi:peptidyl-tRNA hydrolase
LADISQSGEVLKKVIDHYQIKDIAKQVVVIFPDCNTLPGTISLQRIF